MGRQVEVLNKDFPYEELYSIMRAAFQERVDQGLDFRHTRFSIEDLKKDLRNKVVIVARQLDGGENRIVGFQKISYSRDCLYAGLIAVSPECKRAGIGTMLFKKSKELAVDHGCKYMLAETSAKATSSVNWHLKNGYKKICFYSASNNNYYSYLFRNQLTFHPLWSSTLYCNFRFYLSMLWCRLNYTEDGKLRFPTLMKPYFKLRGAIR